MWLLLMSLFFLCSCSHIQAHHKEKRESADLYRRLALAHLSKNNSPEAFKALNTAKSYQPKSSALYNIYALAYLTVDKKPEAYLSFEKALQLDPKNTEARNNFISLLIQNKNFSKALELSKESVEDLTYDYPDRSLFNLGLSYYHLKQMQQATHFLEKSVTKNPYNCSYRMYLSRTYQKTNQIQKALTSWKQSKKVCPSKEALDEIYFYLGMNNYYAKKLQDSKVFLNKVLARGEASPFYRKALKLYSKL